MPAFQLEALGVVAGFIIDEDEQGQHHPAHMRPKVNDARLDPVLFGIQSRLRSPVDLASMAAQVGTSRFHFHRIFREAVGETPRQYVERLRLERAVLRLALTNESVLDICHAVGFRNHETFSRSFKRRYGYKPIEVRQFAQWRRGRQIRLTAASTGHRCELSAVRFRSLRPALLLVRPQVGEYSNLTCAPFSEADRVWSPLVRWAARHGARSEQTAWGLTYDIPGLTPPPARRFDGGICIDRVVAGSRAIRCSRFAGGDYVVVDHVGDAATIIAAFAELGDAINLDSARCVWRDDPSVTLYRAGNTRIDKTRVCLPITRLLASKKRQSLAAGMR